MNQKDVKNQNSEMTSVYHLVDQTFINKFPKGQRAFMLEVYYEFYKLYCEQKKRTILPLDNFIKNARRREI